MKRKRSASIKSKQKKIKLLEDVESKITTIFNLPMELIVTIMEYISIYDRMSLRQTCVSFNYIFNSFSILHKDKIITVSDRTYPKFLKTFTDDSYYNTIISHIQFFDCKYTFCCKFWIKFGKNIKSITFKKCNYKNVNILSSIFKFCPNLEEIKILCDWKEALNVCCNLQYNNLKRIEVATISDYAFNNFILNSPKLRSFETTCKIVDTVNHLKKLRSGKIVNKENLTHKNVYFTLGNSKITSFQTENLDYIGAKTICTLKDKGFNLEKVTFQYETENLVSDCRQLLIDTFADSLKYLDDRSLITRDFNDAHFNDFKQINIDKLINLETLKVKNSKVHSNYLMQITSLKKLKKLTLGTPKRQFLVHTSGTVINTRFPLHKVLLQLPMLQKLEITYAVLPQLDVFLRNTTTNLIELHLDKCSCINMKKVFVALCQKHKSLRVLSLKDCQPSIKNSDICRGIKKGKRNSKAALFAGISQLKNLTSLSLTNCAIGEKSLTEQFKWNQLTYLDMSGNQRITDKGLISISENCPAITEIIIRGCDSITEESFNNFSNLKRLRNIHLEFKKLTHRGLAICTISNISL